MKFPKIIFTAATILPIVSLAVAQPPPQLVRSPTHVNTWCIQLNVPCLIEGNPPRTPDNQFLHKPIGPVLNNWLAHSEYGWKVDHEVIIVYPKSSSDPLKILLKRRIDIDIDNLPATQAFSKILSQAKISSTCYGESTFLNPWYPPITLHAHHISVHEALKRLMIENPKFYIQLGEPLPEDARVRCTLDYYSRPPIW